MKKTLSILFIWASFALFAQGGLSEPFVSDKFQVYNGMANYKIWGMYDFVIRNGHEFDVSIEEKKALDKIKIPSFPAEYVFRERQHWSVVQLYKLRIPEKDFFEVKDSKYPIRLTDILMQREADWTFNFFRDDNFVEYITDKDYVVNVLVDAQLVHAKIFWAYNKVAGKMQQYINAIGIEDTKGNIVWVAYPAFKSWFTRNDISSDFFQTIEEMNFIEAPYLESNSTMGGLIFLPETRKFDVFDFWMVELRIQQLYNNLQAFKSKGNVSAKGEFGELLREVDSSGGYVLTLMNKKGLKIARIQYNDGSLDGPSQLYYDDGKKKAEVNFVSGLADGEWKTYHENGNLASVRNYTSGALEGKYKDYYSNGNAAIICVFENGFLNGPFIKVSVEGKVLMKGSLTQGVKNGKWEYSYEVPEKLFEVMNRNPVFWNERFVMEPRFNSEVLKDLQLHFVAEYELERNEKCLNQLCSRMRLISVD